MADVKIVFTPSGRQGQIAKGTNLLKAARQLGVDIDLYVAAGQCAGAARLMLVKASLPNMGSAHLLDALSPPSASEARYAEKRDLKPGRRLACQCQIEHDIVVDVPATSQVHNQLVRKAADNRVIELRPPVRLCFIEVREPDMHEPSGDLRRVIEALEGQWPDRVSGPIHCDLHVLQQLQPVLRQGKWKITVALRAGRQIVAVWPGLKDQILGARLWMSDQPLCQLISVI